MSSNATQQQNNVYAYIGQRIRERRKLLQLNQTQLAELMGFSYQQMQKYETGVSQVTAGKLLLFARVLNVPPAFFYEGIRLEQSIGKRLEMDVIQGSRTEPLRVVLVEDNPADVILFTKALTAVSEPVEVHTIHDTHAVMDFLQHYNKKFGQPKPDIVMIELLSKNGGIDLIKSIKKNPRTQLLPVVALTSSISVKDMTEAYKSGVNSFIQKSTDLVEYARALDTVIKYWAKVVSLPYGA
jgi:two-component system, response regulator